MPLTKPTLIKPKIGGDPDIWGDKLNKNLDMLDSFNKTIVEDGGRQDEELARLEKDKINKSDIDTVVKTVVDNYVDTVTKPDLGNHVDTVNKPELDRYTETKKGEINIFTEQQKVELDEHEKIKEGEITSFVESKKAELVEYVDTVSKVEINSHTEKKKQEIDVFTEEQKSELDAHEKLKEKELDSYEKQKESELNNHVETVNKVELKEYVDTKKVEIDEFTEQQKIELDAHEKVKEGEINTLVENKKEELVQYVDTVSKVEIDKHTEKKKTEITSHTDSKKLEIDSFTEEQKLELDTHEKLKEGQLDSYEKEKETQLDSHVETVNKVELQNYVDTKKIEINEFTEEQKSELDVYEKEKESELNTHTSNKIGEIDSHVTIKKDEINDFTEGQKAELDAYEKVKEGQLESFKDEKKVEITSHTDAEIERINATGIDEKQDKTDNTLETKDKTVVGAINELLNEKENLIVRSNAINSESTTDVATSKAVNDLRLEVNKKTINAGAGLATTIDIGGGQTISITPKNESILVDEDNIWVNIVNDFTTGGVNKVASAESIKVLKQLIDTLGGGGATKLLRASEVLGEYDYIGNLPSGGSSIAVGSRLFNPTLFLDGIRFEENRYSVELETGLITLNEPYANYDVVWVVEDQMPYHISFCFPTMNLLIASDDIKSRIKLGNVIKILGASDEDDGGHYLVKCEDTAKLNAVDIGEGRYLNEIPNTKISSIKAQVEQNKNDINQNKSDILSRVKYTEDSLNTVDKNIINSINQRRVQHNPRTGYSTDAEGGWWEIDSGNVIRDSITIEYVQTGGSQVPMSGKIVVDQGWNSAGNPIYIREWDCWQQDGRGVIVSKINSNQHIAVYVPKETLVIAYRTYEGQHIKLSMNRIGDIVDTPKMTRLDFLSTLIGGIAKSTNGWCRLVNGMLLQWGSYNMNVTLSPLQHSNTNITVTFPTSFSNTDYKIFGNNISYAQILPHLTGMRTDGSGLWLTNCSQVTHSNVGISIMWFAIGY